jgi:broad specificity phosphatase PhoE
VGRIYLLRHGQTVANRDRIIQGPRIDSGLSELGRQQAAALGRALAAAPLGAVYSSPLVRARDTAAAIVQAHGASAGGHLAVQVAPEIYEIDYGDFIGQRYDEIADDMEQVLDAWRLGFVDQPFPGGESAMLAQHRVRPFTHRLLDQAAGSDVAVVGHGRINRVLIATLTGSGLTTLEEYPQSNASITELDVAGSVTVLRLNDTAHLHMATDAFS